MYIIKGETDHQPRWDAWDMVLRAGALGRPRGMGWRGRWEGRSEWGTHSNPWLIHVNVWQKPLQYCKVICLQLIKINGKRKESHVCCGILWERPLCRLFMRWGGVLAWVKNLTLEGRHASSILMGREENEFDHIKLGSSLLVIYILSKQGGNCYWEMREKGI